jgi:Kef-type K+ transport system membrane component KefB
VITVVAALLIVIFVTAAFVAKSKRLKLGAIIGVLMVCLLVGAFMVLLYTDPSGL